MVSKKIILFCLFLSGAAAFIAEIIWTKPLSLVLGSTTYSFTIILIAIMSGLTFGSWFFGNIINKRISNNYFGYFQILIGLYSGILIIIFNRLPLWLFSLIKTTGGSGFFFIEYFVVFTILFIPASLMGGSWPAANKIYIADAENVAKDTGMLYGINSLGSIIGALFGGFILLPLLGVKISLFIGGGLNVFAGLLFLLIGTRSLTKKGAFFILIIFTLLFTPQYNIKFLNSGILTILNTNLSAETAFEDIDKFEILFHKENLYGSTIVLDAEQKLKILKFNGKIQCANSPLGIISAGNIALIPLEIFKNNYEILPSNALNIGLGCGITSGYLTSNNIQTTTIEINPAIVDASQFFQEVNFNVLDNKNHNLILNDARKWLFYNPKAEFDLITSQPFDFWQEGSGSIISKEFFQIAKSHLTEQGLFAQWAPVYEMDKKDFGIFLKTFQSVFPYFQIYSFIPKENRQITELLFLGSKKQFNLTSDKNSILPQLYLENSSNLLDFQSDITTDDKPILEFSTANHFYQKININWGQEIKKYFR